MDQNASTIETAPPTRFSNRCANCGAELTGRFCAQCGQRAGERLISLRQILADTLEDQFSWNSALPRTVKTLVGGFMDAAPQVVFLLLPRFALLLKLLYVRRRRLYVEHFVFALHLHAVAFLVFTVFVLPGNRWVNLALAGWFTVYAYLALRRVFGQGWFLTLTKFLGLCFAYLFVVVAGVVAATLLVVLTA